jgi:transposase InsO family protein
MTNRFPYSQESKMKVRLRWIQYHENIVRKIAPTCRYFGIARSTFYYWYRRYKRNGVEGLKDLSRRPNHLNYQIPQGIINLILKIRAEKRYGARLMSLYLRKHFQVFVSATGIHRIYRRYNLPKLRKGPQSNQKRKFKRYSKSLPGEVVQIDVKFIQNIAKEPKRYYQFTAIDDCTRFRVLRIYDHNTVRNAIDFIEEVRKRLPVAIAQIQTDNGSEFGNELTWHLGDLGIKHRHIKPRTPRLNGKVERSHRIDDDEFYDRYKFDNKQDFLEALNLWQREYNEERPHGSLDGLTPKEMLTKKLKEMEESKV